tara:strand:- start:2231 stop:2608 length:378 start_codon:yes stop_codon:yes gene_type:complete
MVVNQRFDSVGVHCHALSVVFITMSILKPEVHLSYYMRDAHAFWHICDDSINVGDGDDNNICIHGIKAINAFSMAHSIVSGNRPCFDEIQNVRDHHIEWAKEMIKSLEKWIAKQEGKATKEAMKG